MSIYDFTVKAQDGKEVALSDYRGKVLLIVNTAIGCGFTPQYDELQDIYETYQKDGLEILDFPCNQFGDQAPGSIDVNGEHAIPLYQWLTENSTFEGFDKNPMGLILTQMLKKQDKDFKSTSSVKWNFTKFLIGRDGQIVARFEPMTPLKKVKAKIEEAL